MWSPMPTASNPASSMYTGSRKTMNSDRWGKNSHKWFVYWMQNIPGANNGLQYNGKPLRNWWAFVGDFDTAPPTSIDIDCELIRFGFPLLDSFDGELRSFTFHFGTTPVTVPITPPVKVRRGNNVTVVVRVSMARMLPKR